MPVKVMQEAFTVVTDKDGKQLAIGTLFSVAQEFGMAEELDKLIVNKIIQRMENDGISSPVTINLSTMSIASTNFQQWLAARLEQTTLPAQLLAFSVTAYAAVKDITAFDSFSSFVESLGATMLLKRYSPDIIPIDMLRGLHIDYIRLARDLTQDIRSNVNKPDFLELIQEVSSLIEVKVLAESVSSDDDFEIVKQAGLFGISR
jgi:EAL domain-containing protein (putative c-di-GMP-specific phosphodiesterase class I)